jgi:hypothetical protein
MPAASELPAEVQRLIAAYVASMDHVEVLRALHARREAELTSDELGAFVHLDRAMLKRVMRDLEGAGVVRDTGRGYEYSATSREDLAIAELIAMYNTKPVTLVRAIYARPTPLRSFADAFRLREEE